MAKVSPSKGNETAVAPKVHWMEAGLLGFIFGSRANAPTNVGGIAVLLSFILFVTFATVPLAAGVDRNELLKTAGTMILTSLAYVFGAASGRR